MSIHEPTAAIAHTIEAIEVAPSDVLSLHIACGDQQLKVARAFADDTWGLSLLDPDMPPSLLRSLSEQDASFPNASTLRLDAAHVGSYALFSYGEYSWRNLWQSQKQVTGIFVTRHEVALNADFVLRPNF